MKTHNQIFILIMFALSLLGTTSSSVFAQEYESTATLQETMDWLGAKLVDFEFVKYIYVDAPGERLGAFGLYPRGNVLVGSSFKVDKCTLSLEQEYAFPLDRNTTFKQTLVIPITDIDPLSLQSGFDTKLTTTNSKKTIRISSKNYTNKVLDSNTEESATNFETSGANLFIGYKSSENQKRTERAIEHLLKLCGGKVDPF